MHDAVEEPGAGSAAAGPGAALRGAETPLSSGRCHHCRRGGTGAARLRVVIGKPAEAQHLHDQRRHNHEDECEREPAVVPAKVVVGSQPQVGGPVREKHEESGERPAAVQQRVAGARRAQHGTARAQRRDIVL